MRSLSDILADCSKAFGEGDGHTLLLLAVELDQLDDPEAHVSSLIQFGNASRLNNEMEDAESFHVRALSIYQERNNQKGICRSHIELAIDFLARGMGQQALVHAQDAVQSCSEDMDQRARAWSFNCLGNVYVQLNDHEAAIRAYTSSREIFDSIGDSLAAAKALTNVALVRIDLGDFVLAHQDLQNAADTFRSLDFHMGVAKAVGLMGNVSSYLGNFPDALEKYEEALELYEKLGDQSGIANSYMNIGNNYSSIGDHAKALETLIVSLQQFEGLGDVRSCAHVKMLLGIAYKAHGDNPNAETYLIESYEACHALGQEHLAQHGLMQLADLYTRLEQWVAAKKYIDVLSAQEISTPFVRAGHSINLAMLSQHDGDFEAAGALLNAALQLFQQHHYRSAEAEVLKCLRDLAALKEDLHGYVSFSEAYTSLSEEVKGADARLRMAVRVKEKEIELAKTEKRLEHMKNEKLETTLQRQQVLLSSYAANLVRQTELVEEMRASILSMIRMSASSEGAVEAIRDTLAVQPDAKNNWQRFFSQFKEVYPNFESDLRSKLPTVSPTEQKVCCLVMMGMNTRDIATLLFVSERTIDIHRGNIRKKLGIDRHTDLRTALALFTT